MKKIVLILLCLAMLFSFAACSSSPEDDTSDASSSDSSSAAGVLSSFTTVDLDGNEVDESVFEDYEITMINIWATFCGPCINEMPDLQRISESYAQKGVQIIGIVCDVSQNADGIYNEAYLQQAKSIVEATGVKYISLLPSLSLNSAKLNEVTSVPETFFVDKNGNQIGKSYIGSKNYDDWAKIIDELLNSGL